MFPKIVKLLPTITAMALLTGGVALASDAQESQKYLSFLSRHQDLPNEVQNYLLSAANSYKGSQAGVDVHCFWTKDKKKIELFMQAAKESEKSPNQALNMSYEVQWGKTFTLENYTGKLFDAGRAVHSQSLTLDRACVAIYPAAQSKEAQIRANLISSYATVEKAQSLISLLTILEQEPTQNSQRIKAINIELQALIQQMESGNQITLEARNKFLKDFSGSIEGNQERRSEQAFQNLLASFTERKYFVPRHRYGSFLASFYEVHKNIVNAALKNPIVWTRNQIWSQEGRAQFTIDFQLTTKEELCENYFSYSLPIFLRSIKTELEQGKLVSTQNAKVLFDSLTNFRQDVIPNLVKSCQFKKSIQFLDQEIYDLLLLLTKKPVQLISETEAATAEWNLYFPNKPFMNLGGQQLVELYMNWNAQDLSLNLSNKLNIQAGDVRFIPFRSSTEAATALSRVGVIYWQGEGVCVDTLTPLLAMSHVIGRQYESYHSCTQNKGSAHANLVALFNTGKTQTLANNQLQGGYESGSVKIQLRKVDTANVIPDVLGSQQQFFVSEIKISGGSDQGTRPSPVNRLRSCSLPQPNSAQADFSYCDFERANLSGLNMVGFNFEGANLAGADLRNSNLAQASLRGAQLRGALWNVADPITAQRGTAAPRDIYQQAPSAKEMISYDDCNWAYDRLCAQSSENPRDCLSKAALSGQDIPLACAAGLGLRLTR